MDGDGSIQVNHRRKSVLQYRLVIKLKNTESNRIMLKTLSSFIGGHVVIQTIKKYEYVVWVENHQKKIVHMIKIFDLYPPLTTRLQCQLDFIVSCLISRDVT